MGHNENRHEIWLHPIDPIFHEETFVCRNLKKFVCNISVWRNDVYLYIFMYKNKHVMNDIFISEQIWAFDTVFSNEFSCEIIQYIDGLAQDW